MDWSELGKKVAEFAPLLGSVVGGPAGGAIGAVVASAFGVENKPDSIIKAINSDPEAALKLRTVEIDNKTQLQEIELKKLQATNETMKVEINSGDPFVRRWRPFYGYCVAISWLVQMLGFTFVFGYTAMVNPERLMLVIQQFAVLSGSLIALWGIALAVLGVSVHKRSKDKQGTPESSAKAFLGKILK